MSNPCCCTAISLLMFFALTGSVGARGSFLFCSVPFRFNSLARFVSGFHISQNLSARTGDCFSFSVTRDQMLVAWGDRAPLEHSLAYTPGIPVILVNSLWNIWEFLVLLSVNKLCESLSYMSSLHVIPKLWQNNFKLHTPVFPLPVSAA